MTARLLVLAAAAALLAACASPRPIPCGCLPPPDEAERQG